MNTGVKLLIFSPEHIQQWAVYNWEANHMVEKKTCSGLGHNKAYMLLLLLLLLRKKKGMLKKKKFSNLLE